LAPSRAKRVGTADGRRTATALAAGRDAGLASAATLAVAADAIEATPTDAVGVVAAGRPEVALRADAGPSAIAELTLRARLRAAHVAAADRGFAVARAAFRCRLASCAVGGETGASPKALEAISTAGLGGIGDARPRAIAALAHAITGCATADAVDARSLRAFDVALAKGAEGGPRIDAVTRFVADARETRGDLGACRIERYRERIALGLADSGALTAVGALGLGERGAGVGGLGAGDGRAALVVWRDLASPALGASLADPVAGPVAAATRDAEACVTAAVDRTGGPQRPGRQQRGQVGQLAVVERVVWFVAVRALGRGRLAGAVFGSPLERPLFPLAAVRTKQTRGQ